MQTCWNSSALPGNGHVDMLVGLTTPGADLSWLKAYGLGRDLPGLEDARGDKNELTILHLPAGSAVRRVCLLGLGKTGEQTNTPEELLHRLRTAMAAAMVKARDLHLRHVALAVDSLSSLELPAYMMSRLVREAVYGAHVGLYRYTALKTAHDLPADPEMLSLFASPDLKAMPVLEAAANQAALEAEAVALAKDLVNTPANLLTPAEFADKARDLCAGLPVTCSALNQEALKRAGLNALLAVAQGSANEAAMITLEYTPAGCEESDPLILVGKGLFFDSGGISLKPGLNMHEMKGDMAGAAAVLAAVLLTARLGGRQRIVGILPCAENMPDALAVRPGDVVRTLSGKTVEIINTDAEGRLILCDALTYAQKVWKPARIVDVATLTGACVVALGTSVAGLFATDDTLAHELIHLGEERGEHFWRMPLWDVYAENLKSPTADFANVGPREGGAVTAAVFLKQFVESGTAWAHLDIAGPAYTGKQTPEHAAGGTGFAVRTLAALACGVMD